MVELQILLSCYLRRILQKGIWLGLNLKSINIFLSNSWLVIEIIFRNETKCSRFAPEDLNAPPWAGIGEQVLEADERWDLIPEFPDVLHFLMGEGTDLQCYSISSIWGAFLFNVSFLFLFGCFGFFLSHSTYHKYI